jgi:hypothetical protein
MAAQRRAFGSGLWAVSSYFNPACYQRRLANYRRFRRQLAIPVVTVELSFGRPFELGGDDADILLQLRGSDVLWQKERLLNIGLQALPEECRQVVWMDCDIIFDRHDWPLDVRRALMEFPLVQPFSRLGHLDAATSLSDDVWHGKVAGWQPSLAGAVQSGQPLATALRLTADAAVAPSECALTQEQYWQRVARMAHCGLAWAARRDVLDRFGLYDACVVGGGDVCIASAAYGCFRKLANSRDMTNAERQHYFAWAEPFHRAVAGCVTHVEGALYHLWHGDLRQRRYLERHRRLREYDFDPFHDIARADNDTWRWNSDKPLLHQFVKEYFGSRQEDG